MQINYQEIPVERLPRFDALLTQTGGRFTSPPHTCGEVARISFIHGDAWAMNRAWRREIESGANRPPFWRRWWATYRSYG